MSRDEIKNDMTCGGARKQFALLLYGELSFDDEERVEAHLDACGECRAALAKVKALHAAVDSVEIAPSPLLLRDCREHLSVRLMGEVASAMEPGAPLGWWDRFVDAVTLRTSAETPRFSAEGPGLRAFLRPVGAMALIAIGFTSARLAPQFMPFLGNPGSGFRAMSLGDVDASRVRYVEPSADGRVQIVLDETRQRIVSGGVDDRQIRALLITAAKDPTDPGLRAETVDILTSQAQSADVRDALVFALQRDQNAGVRMKAIEALKPFVNQPDVRTALTHVLLSDANPGLRTQAIDLLTGGSNGSFNASVDRNVDRQIVGTLQELMQRGEQQGYVRERCRRVLQAVNASLETY